MEIWQALLLFLLGAIGTYSFLKYQNSSSSEQELKKGLEQSIDNHLSEAVQKHLNTASESFLKLADQNLEKHNLQAKASYEANAQQMEKDVKGLKEDMGVLTQNLTSAVAGVKSSGTSLGTYVDTLSQNLQAWNESMASNKVRGDLGEEALEKILSDSGLTLGKNYYKQEHKTVDGVSVKPDVVVELANGGNLVIDSKFPYDDFKNAVMEKDPQRQEEHYKKHAAAVLHHVKELSKKSYFSYLNSSPDYTVLYLNSFIYYYHAMRLIPDIIEQARKRNIVIASPEIVIPLLSGVMQQWKEHKVMADIGKVTNEVSQLHSRLKTFISHISGIGKELDKAGQKVNQVYASFNKMVMPSIRRIEDLSVQNEKLEELQTSSSLESKEEDNLRAVPKKGKE